MKKIYLSLFVLACLQNASAQNWLRDMYNPRVNFFIVQREFNDWWKIHGKEITKGGEKKEGEQSEAWKIYKRWEHDITPMMLARKGNRLGTFNQAEANYYAQHKAQSNLRGASSWSYIGNPHEFDDGSGDSSSGRLNCVRFDPVNPAVIYCGAPSGGLWKSPDFGQTWQLLNTDNLAQIGVSDVAINPQNPATIYIATGDIANSACYSIGVLKSINGGLTWDTTGLNWTASYGYLIARLLMSPLDSNTMVAATNYGIFKTIDGGATWVSTFSVYGLTGMEFNPANPNTVYAWGTQLYKSVDGATTWFPLTNGLPDSITTDGFAIGLTPADTTCVYVLVSDTATNGAFYEPYYGLYLSQDAGNSFQLQAANPDAASAGTQGLYDLNIAVSPFDKNQLVIGAVDADYSYDGGITWNAPAFPSHVDHHDIRFFGSTGDTVFSADDGGLFISTDGGNTWAGLNDGIHIGQLYNVSSSAQTRYLYLTGRQDDGTLLQDSSYEVLTSGGDGLECLIDPANEMNMYFSAEDGFIFYSNNGGATYNQLVTYYGTGVNGWGAWNTPYTLDPNNDQNIYVAKDYVYQSTDGGLSWNTLNSPTLDSSNPYNQNYLFMAIAPSNSNYIYAGTYFHLYKSTDGGNTFTEITANLDTPFFCMAVSQTNPNQLWVGTTGARISESVNGGAYWVDYSYGLPTNSIFDPQTIVSVKNSPDALYTGLYYAGGIYYRDSTMNKWMPFSNGLPNVTVNQIEVDSCAGKIRAATYGRDLWESGPYLALANKPAASATYTSVQGHCTDTLQFTDNTLNNPTAWQWYFPGGKPGSSTNQNATVVYPDNGNNYTATFIASNSAGSDSVQYTIPTDVCSGVNELAARNWVQIMPNPNNGNFVLTLSSPNRGKVTFTVFDNIGGTVYQYSLLQDADVMTKEFALSTLAKGVYYVHVTSEEINTVQKLVVGN